MSQSHLAERASNSSLCVGEGFVLEGAQNLIALFLILIVRGNHPYSALHALFCVLPRTRKMDLHRMDLRGSACRIDAILHSFG